MIPRASTQKTIIPAGYSGNDFNKWIKHLHKEIDKIRKTTLSTRLK